MGVNISIIDNSLITCTLIYRLLEERLPDSNINYFIDPTDILLAKLSKCDLIIIDESLTHYRGTEILGHLYDYIHKTDVILKFPKILFCSTIEYKHVQKRMKAENLLDVPFEFINKPFYPNELETKVIDMLGLTERRIPIFSPSCIPTSISSFGTGLRSVFTV